MDEALLLTSAADGDPSALEAIYDQHAFEVHDLCYSMLRDPVAAAGATLETWRLTADRLGRLEEPAMLRPLMLAIARHQSMARQSIAAPIVAALRTPADVAWRAVGELDAGAQAIAYLQARHEMVADDPRGLAPAIGHTPATAYDIVVDANAEIERHLDTALLTAVGQDNCDELRTIVRKARKDAAPKADRVSRHAAACEACDSTLATLPAGLALVGSIPPLSPPAALRAQALAPSPAHVTFSGVLGAAADEVWPPPLRRRHRRSLNTDGLAAAVAVAILVCALAGGAWLLLRDDDSAQSVAAGGGPVADGDGDGSGDGPDDPEQTPTSFTTLPGIPGIADVITTTTAHPIPDVDPGPTTSTTTTTVDPSSTTTTTTLATTTTTGPGTSTTTTTAPPDGGQLTLDVVTVVLKDGLPPGVITVSNSGNAPLTWTADSGTFEVSPAGGSLAPNESVIVEVSLPSPVAEGTYGNGVLFLADETAKGVSVRVERNPEVTALSSNPTQFCDKGNNKVTLTATVTDENSLTVQVRWQIDGGSPQSSAMSASGDTWSHAINPVTGATSFSWWVIATDSRGNQTQTAHQSIPFVTC